MFWINVQSWFCKKNRHVKMKFYLWIAVTWTLIKLLQQNFYWKIRNLSVSKWHEFQNFSEFWEEPERFRKWLPAISASSRGKNFKLCRELTINISNNNPFDSFHKCQKKTGYQLLLGQDICGTPCSSRSQLLLTSSCKLEHGGS